MRAAVYFGGAEGAGLGLKAAGYETVSYEYWEPAWLTALANGFDSRLHDLSDASLDGELVNAELGWFSPPCQPFSAAGDGEGEFDERDGFPWTLRIIALKRYPVVIIENVKGLTFAKHAGYFGGILGSLRELGYEPEVGAVQHPPVDLGLGQTRQRCIIVARCDGGRISWPDPTHSRHGDMFLEPWVAMAQALGWSGELSYRRGAGMIERHGPRGPWATDEIPAPTVHANSAKDWQVQTNQKPDGVAYQLAGADKPCPTVSTFAGRNWWWMRAGEKVTRLTVAELAALQGFPPDYVWCGSRTAQAKQIGNAVPPVLARVVAEVNRPARVAS